MTVYNYIYIIFFSNNKQFIINTLKYVIFLRAKINEKFKKLHLENNIYFEDKKYTVKPLYSGHSRDRQNCPLLRGGPLLEKLIK